VEIKADWHQSSFGDQPAPSKKEADHNVRARNAVEIKADWHQSSFGDQQVSTCAGHSDYSEQADEFRDIRRPRSRGRPYRGRQEAGPYKPSAEENHSIEKDKYQSYEESITKETVFIKRKRGGEIFNAGNHFRPETDWSTIGLPWELLALLVESGFYNPFPIQVHAIRLVLENQDDHIIVQAPVDSGKTMIFVLSTLTRVNRADFNAQVMLVAPTNEQIVQLTSEYKSFAEPLNITITHVKKGDKKFPGQVLLMTPDQCTGLFMLKGGNKPVLDHVKFLIFDEADHLLNIEEQPEFFKT
jgi:hypothetical protein